MASEGQSGTSPLEAHPCQLTTHTNWHTGGCTPCPLRPTDIRQGVVNEVGSMYRIVSDSQDAAECPWRRLLASVHGSRWRSGSAAGGTRHKSQAPTLPACPQQSHPPQLPGSREKQLLHVARDPEWSPKDEHCQQLIQSGGKSFFQGSANCISSIRRSTLLTIPSISLPPLLPLPGREGTEGSYDSHAPAACRDLDQAGGPDHHSPGCCAGGSPPHCPPPLWPSRRCRL